MDEKRTNSAVRILRCLAIFLVVITASTRLAWSQISLDKEGKPAEKGRVQIFGDFRNRFESDWESRRADGTFAADRERLRIRLRLGLNWNPTSLLSAGVRVRSGSRNSQQSPHVTYRDFSGNSTGDQDILLDRYFFQARRGGFFVWGGRNDLPLFKQNELFWDDDVTPVGVGGRYVVNLGTSSLTFNAGTFSLPDGGIRFHGNLHAGQVVYAGRGGRFNYTAAGGVARFDGSTKFRNLRNGNGARDYTIWAGNLQAATNAGGRRLTLGFDLMRNAEDYSGSADAFAAANRDEKNGLVASAHWGAAGRRNDWQVGYYYARIETLAVNASFAQDDWERWGSATQTDSSNFKGHEVRFTYVLLNNRTTAVARLYVTDAITSRQQSRRFRLDFNTGF